MIVDRTVYSLLTQARLPDRVQIVDDGSAVDYTEVRTWWEEHHDPRVEFSWAGKPNAGKKSAHALTFRSDHTADIFITVDSDTCLEHNAIREGLKPFADRRVQSVAGIELAANHSQSLLVKLKSVNTLVWQFITCSAQNVAGHVPAATWVAAWQRVVTAVRAVGGTQVTWLWTISHSGSAPIRPYWPGAAYVSWVGIDGYFERPSDTYGSVFGSSVAQVRSFTGKPILLSEVGVGPGTGRKPQDIAALFGGIRAQHLLGSVWFDVDQRGGMLYQDWRLEGNSAAVAAFRQAVSGIT